MRWKLQKNTMKVSTWIFSSVGGGHTDITAWSTRLRETLPGLKDCLHSAPISLKQMSPLYIIPLFVSNLPFFMVLQCFGRRAARHKRFSPADTVYFSILALRKFHPRTVWLEYKGIVQSKMRNRVKMNERCYEVGRRRGSWEGLQNADRNLGGLRMKMKIQEFFWIPNLKMSFTPPSHSGNDYVLDDFKNGAI